MILGDPVLAATAHDERGITLDELFRRTAARRPDAVALADAPNRQAFTDGAPWRLTYAEADRIVSGIAGRFRRMGLPADAVVGIQMPNIVENVLTILGVLRAGMIAAPLPLLWRRADAVAALTRVGAKALIACRRSGGFAHCQLALHVAADVFSVRYVCGFGDNVPDGVVPFDDLVRVESSEAVAPVARESDAAAHLAIVTFEAGADGPVPVARRHLELLAGGLGIFLEGGIGKDAAILSATAPSSFAGLCLTLLPWLLSGGTLALHHPFDAGLFARQYRDERAGTLVLPAPAALHLAEAGLFADQEATVLAPWPAPERLAASPVWRERSTALVDVPIFGEAGFVATRRGADGRPVRLARGAVTAPSGTQGAVMVVALGATERGTLALRGPMVPRYAFPPGIEHTEAPHFAIGDDGFVDTGYRCRVDPADDTLDIAGPPAGMVGVGFYRFPLGALLQTVGGLDAGADLAVLPDPLTGQRLVGTAADLDAVAAALAARGLNPLVAAAFSRHGEAPLRAAAAAG